MSSARKAGLLILAIGILLLVGSCRSMSKAYGLRSSGRELVGRVVDRDEQATTLEIRYRVAGETYVRTFEVDRSYFMSHRKHAKVDLLYLPADPDEAVIANDPSLSGSNTILLLLMALGVGTLGLVLAILQPGAGNIFKRPTKLKKREPSNDDSADEGDESDEGPAFIAGRPV